MPPMSSAARTGHELEREYRARGFLRESFALGGPTFLPELCHDVSPFDAKLAEWQALGYARVPYLFTAAIGALPMQPSDSVSGRTQEALQHEITR